MRLYQSRRFHVRGPGEAERVIEHRPGDMLHIGAGEAHVAHPRGAARILVVEPAASA